MNMASSAARLASICSRCSTVPRCRLVVTLHTVLEKPSADERRVLEGLLRRAARVVVMAERGREILQRVYAANPRQIAMIAHGVPDRELVDPATLKERFG